MKEAASDKEPRREKIRKSFTVALLPDDNLNDFDKMFYGQPAFARQNLVRDNADWFGDLFIILPNAIYGDWESAICNYKKLMPAEADKAKHEALVNY